MKHTIRRIKQKEDNLINLTDEINKINYFKVIVFDVNDPTNIITLKNINNKQIIIKHDNLLFNINNEDFININYKFIN